MEENPYSGVFIVVEGIDGAGKSIQARKLHHYLKLQHSGVVYTKEPTYRMPVGHTLRKALKGEIEKSPLALQNLFVKDREEHLYRFIIPRLGRGQTVICDRYFLSTIAYGSIDLPIDRLIKMHDRIPDFILPDLTLIIDLDPEISLERRKSDSKFDIFEEAMKLRKVRETYKILARRFDDVFFIDGAREEDEVFEEMLGYVNTVLARRPQINIAQVREYLESLSR